MNNLRDIVLYNSKLVIGLVVSLLGMGAAFGLQLSANEQGAIVALVAALLALVAGVLTEGVKKLVLEEPALLLGTLGSALALLVAFGVQITTQQTEAAMGFVGALLLLLAAVFTRSQVYSPATAKRIRQRKAPAAPRSVKKGKA